MQKLSLRMAGILVLFCIFAVSANAEGIKEGKWSMTMVTKMEGLGTEAGEMMNAMKNMPPEAAAMMKQMPGQMGMQISAGAEGISATVTQCVTDKSPVPEMQMPDPENCKQSHDIIGNTVSFQVNCKSKSHEMESSGSVTYKDESMEGLVKSHQLEDGQSIDATIMITGKYLGKCE